MMAVLAIPSPFDRRIALGSQPGQPSTVFVKNGRGGSVGQINPSPGARGGVVTATGQLNSDPNDLTEDVVAGTPPNGRSPATVSVYDGKTLSRTARFRPFPDFPRAGVSVATGNITGPQADIIVGRVGPGPSLVRIFSANGRLLQTIKGTIPGPLPNGVTVASADFNGDNYDDVAIGAGRGAATRPLTPLSPPASGLGATDAQAQPLPRVVVLDGSTLLNGSQRPRRLFSFVATGGPGSGVNLAGGYYDPRTRPGILANLITTPQTGPMAGTVQVWVPPFEAPHVTPALIGDPTVPGASPALAAQAQTDALRHGTNGAWSQSSELLLYCLHHFSGQASPQFASLARSLGLPATNLNLPRVSATLYPFGRHLSTGLNIAVTHLGKSALDAVAAWTNPNNAVYTSIDTTGAVSTIRTPTP